MKVRLEGQKRSGPGSGQAAHQSSGQKQERQRLKREIKRRCEDSRDTFMADRSTNTDNMCLPDKMREPLSDREE